MERMPKMIKMICLVSMLIYLVSACATTGSTQEDPQNRNKPRGSFLLRFYRGPLNHLSAVRVGQCPMYPSDSAYGLQAIKKHGPIVGWAMAFDRLLRCGRDETRLAPRVIVNGKWKSYDPVENNDFWWHEEKKDTQ